MGRRSNTEERRAQIARGLLEAVSRHGYEGATIPKIAQAAQVAPGIVHYHFGSKLEIAREALRLVEARVAEALAGAKASTGEGLLAAAATALLAKGPDSDPAAFRGWIMLALEAARNPDLGYGGFLRRITRHPKLWMASRSRKDLREHAAAVLALVHGYGLLSLVGYRIPGGSAAPSARRMIAGLVGGRGKKR